MLAYIVNVLLAAETVLSNVVNVLVGPVTVLVRVKNALDTGTKCTCTDANSTVHVAAKLSLNDRFEFRLERLS